MAVENELIYIVRLNAKGESEVVKANRVLDETGKTVEQTNKKVGTYKKTLSKTSKSTRAMGNQTNYAGQSLLGFIRVAQDAPYGMRGIANNLQQVTLEMGRSVKASGGLMRSLKAMSGALMGPLGILAAVSVVTAFGPQIIGFFKGTGKSAKQAAESAKAFAKRLHKVNDEISNLKNVSTKGLFATGKLVQQKNNLKSIQKQYKAFNKIFDQIQNQIGLSKIKIENMSTGQLAELIRKSVDFGKVESAAKSQSLHAAQIIKKNLKDVGTAYRLPHQLQLPSLTFSGKISERISDANAQLKKFDDTIDNVSSKLDMVAFTKGFSNAQALEASRKQKQFIKDMRKMRVKAAQQQNKQLLSLNLNYSKKVRTIFAKNLSHQQEMKEALAQYKIYMSKRQNILNEQMQKATQARKKRQQQIQQFDQNLLANLHKHMQKTAQPIQIMGSLHILDRAKARQQLQQQKARFQKQFIAQTQHMQSQLTMSTMTRLQRVNFMERQSMNKIKQLRQQDKINYAQYEQRKTLITKQASQKRTQIANQEMQSKIQNARMVANLLGNFALLITGNSKGNAKKRFEINKQLNAANAVMNTAAGVTKALAASPPPWNFIQAAAVGAAGAVQIQKIESQQFMGGGIAGGSGGSVGYRGPSFGQQTVPAPRPGPVHHRDTERKARSKKEPRQIQIVDGFGNMVAKGQEEIDRRGGGNYLRGSDG